MGIETDKQVLTSQADSHEKLIRDSIADAQERRDTPLNGGFGLEVGDFDPMYHARRETLARFLAHNTVPPDCTVEFMPTLPYSGGEPLETVVIKHPPVDERWSGMLP